MRRGTVVSINRFSARTIEHYVYLYIDPRDGKPFPSARDKETVPSHT